MNIFQRLLASISSFFKGPTHFKAEEPVKPVEQVRVKRYLDTSGRLLINERGLEIVKHFESCRLKAYPDPASPLAKACSRQGIRYYDGGYKSLPNWQTMSGSPWTIAWGRIRYNDGSPIKEGDACTQEDADAWLFHDLENEASNYIYSMTAQEQYLTDDQFSALVGFCYNRGCGRYDQKLDDLVDAGLADHVLTPAEAKAITDCLISYDWAGPNKDYMEGLARRRYAERELFNGGDWRKFDSVEKFRKWKKENV